MTEKEFEQHLLELTKEAYKSNISIEHIADLIDMFLERLSEDMVTGTKVDSEILFHVEENDIFSLDGGINTVVYITPKHYFEKYGFMDDRHFESDILSDFKVVQENVFVYRGTVKDAREFLLNAGFVESKQFSKKLFLS